MADDEEIATCTKEFILEALKKDVRIDGRSAQDTRQLDFEFSLDSSSSTVTLGNTRVFTSIHAELGPPHPVRPHEGTIQFDVNFSPMASPNFEADKRNEEGILISRLIERLFILGKAVDREALCVLTGTVVWVLKVHIHVLDHDGNLMDACVLGTLSALGVHRRPEVSVTGEEGQTKIVVHPVEEKEPLQLTLHHLPIPFTFAFFGDGSMVALDPDLQESATMSGCMTVVVDPQGNICSVLNVKGIGLSLPDTMQCIRLAVERGKQTAKQLQDALNAYETARVKARVRRRDDEAFMSKAQLRSVTVVPRASVEQRDAASASNTDHKPHASSESGSDEPTEKSPSQETSHKEAPQDDVMELSTAQCTAEDNLGGNRKEAGSGAETVCKAKPVFQRPTGEMDEVKIEWAAALIAQAANNGEDSVTDLKDAVKKGGG